MILRDEIALGKPRSMDELGSQLGDMVKPPMRGPEARADKYSVLNEMTPEQLKTYSPDQIVTLLKQRENVSYLHIIPGQSA